MTNNMQKDEIAWLGNFVAANVEDGLSSWFMFYAFYYHSHLHDCCRIPPGRKGVPLVTAKESVGLPQNKERHAITVIWIRKKIKPPEHWSRSTHGSFWSFIIYGWHVCTCYQNIYFKRAINALKQRLWSKAAGAIIKVRM